MKRLFFITVTLLAATFIHAEPAKRSEFTIKQIAEHLGLKGGNWTVKFDEKCYAGFIITDISATGEKKEMKFWSSDSAFQHEFHMMENVTDKDRRFHDIKFSSFQIGESEVEQIGIVNMKTQFSFGSGFTYSAQLTNSGMQRHQTNDLNVKLGEPTMLFEFTTDESKREFRLEIIFSATKPEKED